MRLADIGKPFQWVATRLISARINIGIPKELLRGDPKNRARMVRTTPLYGAKLSNALRPCFIRNFS
jgi:hypothetical protein